MTYDFEHASGCIYVVFINPFQRLKLMTDFWGWQVYEVKIGNVSMQTDQIDMKLSIHDRDITNQYMIFHWYWSDIRISTADRENLMIECEFFQNRPVFVDVLLFPQNRTSIMNDPLSTKFIILQLETYSIFSWSDSFDDSQEILFRPNSSKFYFSNFTVC